MLQTVEFPTSVPDLHSGLTNMDGNDLTLKQDILLMNYKY
jgi:hypothetical protein